MHDSVSQLAGKNKSKFRIWDGSFLFSHASFLLVCPLHALILLDTRVPNVIFYSLHAIHIHLILEERTFTIVSAGNLCATVDHSLTTATCLSSNQASNIVNLPSVVPVPMGHASLSLTQLTACLGIATVGYCTLPNVLDPVGGFDWQTFMEQ